MSSPRAWGAFPILMILIICLLPQAAMAYIGPGTGLSAIGAFLAIVLAVVVGLFGFVWYPLKRLFRGRKKSSEEAPQDGAEE